MRSNVTGGRVQAPRAQAPQAMIEKTHPFQPPALPGGLSEAMTARTGPYEEDAVPKRTTKTKVRSARKPRSGGAAIAKAVRPPTRKRRASKPADCFAAVAGGRSGGGLAVLAAVIEGDGTRWDIAQLMQDKTIMNGSSAKKGGGVVASPVDVRRTVRALIGKRTLASLSNIFAALGNEHRVAILVKLLEGSAGYHALQEHTGLGAGPLYHHIAQLRLAGLILPKSRDVYEMTRGGRNVLLLALAAATLGTDKRRRPTAGE